MIRISGSFTQILRSWMQRRRIECRELSSKLDLLAGKETVSADEWRVLLAEAAELSPEQPIGIQIGSEVQVNHVGVLGYLVLNSQTLADALETYLHCERHFYGVNFAELRRTKSEWSLTWPGQMADKNALFVQVALTALVTFLRQRFPRDCDLLSVSFVGEMPGDIGAYENFFGCTIQFASTYPGITFNGTTVSMQTHDLLPDDFRPLHRQQVEAFSSVISLADPFLLRLQHVLLRLIPEANASLPQVALKLNCSARSVQRKLGKYDLSYQVLLDGVREQLARRYLLRTSLTLSELPLLLGFSDQSAFSRAFKHWTGVTPGRFRQLGGR